MEGQIPQKIVHLTVESDIKLEGALAIPSNADGIVLFAHGSGSSRHSPRNQFVAKVLNDAGLATLLFDLLTTREEEIDRQTRHLRFDIGMLARRVIGAIDWLKQQEQTQALHIGLFGASTGAGAALVAAANRVHAVEAVVSRGGRPDLAKEALADVQAPTLLIVGGKDKHVIELNKRAMQALTGTTQMEIVPGASHLFEESGKLASVAELAQRWFTQYLTNTAR